MRDTIITMTVEKAGLPMSTVLAVLLVSRKRVRGWLSDQLGTPRDYWLPSGADEIWFTPVGIRNLAALVGQDITVVIKKRGQA